MSDSNLSLKLLLEGCLRKNRNSQRKLYEHFYGYGMNICLMYSRNREEALEILNDSFLKVFAKLDRYDSAYPFKSWFRRILINTAIDYHRTHQKYPIHLELSEIDPLVGSEPVMPVLSPQNDMLPIIQQLPPAYRMVFNLYVMEGYKHHEIAEMLNISVGTSKSNLLRAKAKLKKMVINNNGKIAKNS